MTRAEGVKRLKKLVGDRATWREYDRPSSPEAREYARTRRAAIKSERAEIDAEIARRLKELDWYQDLMARRAALVRERDTLGFSDYYRIEVGETIGIGFHVQAGGDNWAEAIRALEAKKAASLTDKPKAD